MKHRFCITAAIACCGLFLTAGPTPAKKKKITRSEWNRIRYPADKYTVPKGLSRLIGDNIYTASDRHTALDVTNGSTQKMITVTKVRFRTPEQARLENKQPGVEIFDQNGKSWHLNQLMDPQSLIKKELFARYRKAMGKKPSQEEIERLNQFLESPTFAWDMMMAPERVEQNIPAMIELHIP